jgi:type VI secretion system protein ImpB
MSKQASVAPKERVNIVYKPAGDAQQDVELPLKMLMMGDYTQRTDGRLLEDRKPVSIDKDNFNQVMAAHNLELNLTVPNKLKPAKEGEPAEELKLQLALKNIRDFEPDRVAKQVPELNRLLELREALISLKGPLGNIPAFRKKLQQVIKDDVTRKQLCEELKLDVKA